MIIFRNFYFVDNTTLRKFVAYMISTVRAFCGKYSTVFSEIPSSTAISLLVMPSKRLRRKIVSARSPSCFSVSSMISRMSACLCSGS